MSKTEYIALRVSKGALVPASPHDADTGQEWPD